MCGINGALVFDGSSFRITNEYLVRMRDAMVHRGPDGAGVWIPPNARVGLGHRRLSIIDLSPSANQPLCNEDGTVWVAFNGEIYNHAELRNELNAAGSHRWSTDHSDTEVIVHAFEQWGIDCVKRFRGMFAIALWDVRNSELWLIRDRIGIKPLYYAIHNGRLVFASEIKALLEDPQQKRAVNEYALYQYLTMVTTPAPDTLFEGINKLPPGTWLRCGYQGNVRLNRYWDVWDYTEPLSHCNEADIAERLLSELRTAVRLRKVSDVPVGVFLSGGIDSSTNAALFAEDETTPIRTFSIAYDEEYKSNPSELPFARQIARLVGAEHKERIITQDDLFRFLPEMIRLQDEPIGDPVCLPVYEVSKLARDNGVVVCQVGEGSDELFIGYAWWMAQLRLQRMTRLPLSNGLATLGMGALQLCGLKGHASYEMLRRSNEGRPMFWGGAFGFGEAEKRQLLSSDLSRRLRGASSWDVLAPLWQRFQDRAWDCSHANWMSFVDLSIRLPELLLMRVDKMSMGVSLECRVPFLDHKFVELAMSIPSGLKTKDGVSKAILKKAVRGVIPDNIIDRKKQGFGVPIREWYGDRLGGFIASRLSAFNKETGILNPAEVQRLITREARKPKLWLLLNLALWWEHYIGGGSSRLLGDCERLTSAPQGSRVAVSASSCSSS